MGRKNHDALTSSRKETKSATKNRRRSVRHVFVDFPAPQIPSGYFAGPIVEIKARSIWKRLERETATRRGRDKCCKDHPEPPTVEITGIEFKKDLTGLKVKVKASHPCGIMKVTAVLANVKVENMPGPKGFDGDPIPVPAEVVEYILFGDDYLKDSDVFACVETVKPTLRIPLTKAFGTPFHVAVIVEDCCGGTSGAHSTRYLVV